jgi:tRNA nucleotidyltransferase (CCA-adding enzyme)
VTSGILDRLSKLFTTVLSALDGEHGVWVVGGAVRDLLLDREPTELDLVVEGDAIPVARRAAERLGGEILVHDRFGTATVRGAGVAFDLAGARRETYVRPGALPDVELGAPLEDDLARRDFTVNTFALRLDDGALTAWPGAREDLAAGVLRVLHDRSFRDDPTRLLRLARYAARLRFAPEPRTAELAAEAVTDGALSTVTGERLGAELRLLVGEPQPAALAGLERYGLGAALLPAFTVDAPLIERAVAICDETRAPGDESAADAAAPRGPARPRRDLVALGATVRRADAAELATRLRELAFPAPDAAAIVACAGVDALMAELAGRPPSAADLVLRRQPLEAAVLAAAGGSEPARDWLTHGRNERLAITGDDLLAAGLSGPAVGRALEQARAALLDGSAPDRDAQLAAALAPRT